MVTQVAAGIYAYLPLGFRVLRKISDIIREEMDAEGGQEMLMPSLLPIEVYEASGRDKTMGEILFRVEDNRGRQFALGPTHVPLEDLREQLLVRRTATCHCWCTRWRRSSATRPGRAGG